MKSMRERLLATSMICGAALLATQAYAQGGSATVSEVVVTGSRIQTPGIQSASPIVTVGADQIRQQQTPEAEKILRLLPGVVPQDGDAVNNGTAGVTTLNLRGLGAQRNLVLLNGKRMTPYNINGEVDLSRVPTALLERVDVITGGASAVYGSDAISGAVNFITKTDFEGFEADSNYSLTGDGDGEVISTAFTVGANSSDGRGNAVVSLNYSKREGVLFAARPLGLLGIVTATGGNLGASTPPAPPAGCGGPGSVASGGSTTTVPTRTQITGVGTTAGQFREDGSLGANCSVFNFNPFNYYQTPQERWGGSAFATYDVMDNVEAYANLLYSRTEVRQQIAPSGIFGNSFFVPVSNPFLSASARNTLLTQANTARLAGSLPATSWRDLNANGVVDSADDLSLVIRRRTGELGERSSTYLNNAFQFNLGFRGEVFESWDWDVFLQHGQSDRTNVAAGYTNVTNFGNALNAVAGPDGKPVCRSGGSCVPVNVFGGYGTITPEMAQYVGAIGIEKQNYRQTIVGGSITGYADAIKLPTAALPVQWSFGAEYREEAGETVPDECLKLAPASCLGGAGGNTLPIKGGFDVYEIFGETIIPVFSDLPFAKSLEVELGGRFSDYNPSGSNTTWKAGVTWEPVEGLRLRAMQQRAVRAPNVGELAAPLVSGLRNAVLDPCSVTNAGVLAGNATLRARCISTGMTAAQVGTVQDIVSGQISTFEGTNLALLPKPEEADTTTVGFIWTPDYIPVVSRPFLSVDYYRIRVEGWIGRYEAQEVLDACYNSGVLGQCAKVIRINGDLASPASGIQLFTQNLDYREAEGVELNTGFGLDFADLGASESLGRLRFELALNYYMTNERRSDTTLAKIDCMGYYGTSCGNPTHEIRFVQRTNWDLGDFSLGYQWRYQDEVSIEETQKAATFPKFRKIEAYHYLDLNGSWAVNDAVRLSASVRNVFEEEPPIVGNEAATTSANSGNTLPSNYDTLGRVFAVGLNVRF
ncbi:TonB-dependent receptor [Phenylobacterium sp.]|uniref:TonB-dependent receptor plug domain-containing protein n=1 Tax=Phenylobacterium sp. TaxID=1871053 RepID=UPI0025F211C9|nr:TonB-dependent receptor [Phenylobacterium sp.]MCA6286543.1 TonB-dependent receptor [Phenylobacterium sp.]MCA6310061.1 TonB-dependent receptor [Phenylobacterium sp.]MCA6324370.1 TonB-dependent receptor [Phenylobacterium sp.]MCA6336871.1 TonB-dependent receptor [Phenylobacterium sp.]MCA6339468.1 TonB-dependent receptor [Phenylobacterium sp.]